MKTFFLGLVILLAGGLLYGGLCQRVFGPDDRATPAVRNNDGVDFVPLTGWKNSLVNLLNIAGTGPILGPIQGILFGPIAFLAIPIGCVIGGAMHDYFNGMICLRGGGLQMPQVVRRFTNRGLYGLYTVFVGLLLLLLGVVFTYTPGDIAATQLFGLSGAATAPSTWVIYGVIFAYFTLAALLPIDKIIGRIYPFFGALLILSSVGIFLALCCKGYAMTEVWSAWTLNGFDFRAYFTQGHFLPTFFITVACGILSGFHSTQTSLVARTVTREGQGRMVFYNMMIAEGFIAMVWAAGTMAMIGLGAERAGVTMGFADGGWQYFAQLDGALTAISPTSVVGIICKSALGPAGGLIAVLGVILLPITSGDTALRSLRLIFAEVLHISQEKPRNRLLLSLPIFAGVIVILIYAKVSPTGFNTLWRYFGWANQTIAVFSLACILIWMLRSGRGRFAWMSAFPLAFYAFVVASYILSAPIGFRLPWTAAYIGGGVFAAAVLAFCLHQGKRGPREPEL